MSKKATDNNKPDFSEFDNWRKESRWEEHTSQEDIARRNIELLLNRDAWSKEVTAFETELNKIADEKERERKRNEFEIYFDSHKFTYEETKYLQQEFDFSKYLFPCAVSFIKVKFYDYSIIFSEAIFKGNVSFDGAIFGYNSVNFCKTNFGKNRVSFEGTEFGKRGVEFTGAIFKGGYISFSRAEFKGQFKFTPDKENSTIKNADFDDLEVGGNLTINADFNGEATFQRLDVKGSANFSGCKFEQVPNFRDMNLNRPPEVAGMEVPPEKLEMNFNPLAKYSGDKDDVTKYRKLKSMAIAASDHIKSGEFFAYEMMAKRGVETKGQFALLLDHFYGLLSGYGQSYKRPLIWLGGFWTFFAFINLLTVLKQLNLFEGLFFAARLSLHNLIPFISSLARFVSSPDKYTSGFQTTMNSLESGGVNIGVLTLFGMTQQFIGAILLFLLLLGLRNKFRLK